MNALRAVVLGAVLLAAAPAFAARDVMIVLDNSGSMKHNDPSRLAPVAVSEFIKNQPRDTRVAILLFATKPELVMPLTPAEVAADGAAQDALARFNYRGALTQTPAAIERAIYELRDEGRPDAKRVIVLMTDGIIDTGDAAKTAQMDAWLRKDLAAQAARDRIAIFGIAFTEQADYELLQSLAATTNAEYFRVLSAAGIGKALHRIESVLNAGGVPSAPVTPAAPAAAQPAPASEPEQAAAPTAPQSAPVGSATAKAPRDTRWDWLWWTLIVVTLGVGGYVFWWRRQYAPQPVAVSDEPDADARASRRKRDTGVQALLYDSMASYEIGDKPVVIGRAGGNDPGKYYVIVPEKTVGRWHATIERRGQTFWIRDEGSVNGTFVNGERVVGERPLKHKDQLKFHNHQFDFEIPELHEFDRTVMQPNPHPMN